MEELKKLVERSNKNSNELYGSYSSYIKETRVKLKEKEKKIERPLEEVRLKLDETEKVLNESFFTMNYFDLMWSFEAIIQGLSIKPKYRVHDLVAHYQDLEINWVDTWKKLKVAEEKLKRNKADWFDNYYIVGQSMVEMSMVEISCVLLN